MRASLAVVAVGLIACGHRGGSSVAPTSEPAAAGTVALPAGPPLVTPGERMTYGLELEGFAIASYMFGVGEVQDVGGRRAVLVESHAKSLGLANMVAKVDDRFTSWIDVETGRSVRFQVTEYATGSDQDIEHSIVDLAGRTGDTITVSFQLDDGAPAPEPQQVTQPDIWDYNAFLVALRAWEAPPGTTVTTEVFRSRYLWALDVTVRGKETLVTELGELPTVRFDCHAKKLDRAGGAFPATPERDFSIWISDDDGRVPLQTVAQTDYGDVKMTIVDYQPGAGTRLRP